MAEKLFKTRTQQKNDTENKWSVTSGFIPKKGEIIVYNVDNDHTSPRLKVGDGVTEVNALPFVYEYKAITADDDGAGTVYLLLTGLTPTYVSDTGALIIA